MQNELRQMVLCVTPQSCGLLLPDIFSTMKTTSHTLELGSVVIILLDISV